MFVVCCCCFGSFAFFRLVFIQLNQFELGSLRRICSSFHCRLVSIDLLKWIAILVSFGPGLGRFGLVILAGLNWTFIIHWRRERINRGVLLLSSEALEKDRGSITHPSGATTTLETTGTGTGTGTGTIISFICWWNDDESWWTIWPDFRSMVTDVNSMERWRNWLGWEHLLGLGPWPLVSFNAGAKMNWFDQFIGLMVSHLRRLLGLMMIFFLS